MSALNTIHALIQRFEAQRDAYKAGRYNETQLRRDFLDPFFEAFGWDVANRRGYAERYREVIHEPSIEVEGQARAADYAFRIGDKTVFLVEAKKPAVNIETNPEPAFQLRRYGWSARLPVSILTDFEQLAIYDCTQKPSRDDKPGKNRISLFNYPEYTRRWDHLIGLISREAVLRGSLDQFIAAPRAKKGTMDVDDDFLREIEHWRVILARNLALRNPVLTPRELNHAVQATIDRIIFLRICEDRGIEPDNQLRDIAASREVYAGLVQLFQRADARYNSGLFHFNRERDRPTVHNGLTLSLALDDRVLKDIIRNLYYPDSPYAFSYIPTEILGQVYERFLGKVIHLTAGHRAQVEEKPEVRKAGGVYYTPTYIVEYIVKNTLGRLLEGKTPAEAAELALVDPACGSGSFLVGAYQYLLDWHLEWYSRHDPEKWAVGSAPAVYAARGGWQLTSAKKKEILLNNIYGVDIDTQAVEVSKLSLLLKVLEGESAETVGRQMALFKERVLPDLGHNIQCGNSLIGQDYYSSQQLTMFDEEEVMRVNAFDWQAAFPQVFARGGFDAVIGNPPYVRQESLGELKRYFQRHYRVYHGIADLYTYFIERGVRLLRPGGLFSYIVANKWMRANYGEPLRRWLKEQRIEEIVDFGDLPVFEQATTYPCILRVRGGGMPGQAFHAVQVKTLAFDSLEEYAAEHAYAVAAETLHDVGWSLADQRTAALLAKLRATGKPLGEVVAGKIYRGVLTGLNEAFVIDAATRERLIAEDSNSAEVIKPFLLGRDVKRYQPPESRQFIIFTRRKIHIKKYPAIEKHLAQYRNQLLPKPLGWSGEKWGGRKPGNYKWYEIQDTIEYYAEFEMPKIIYPNICKQPEFTYDESGLYTNQKCFIITKADLYLLGILNSSVTYFLFKKVLPKLRGDYYEPSFVYFKDFPIHIVDFTDPSKVRRHTRMVGLVEGMLALHKKLSAALIPQERAVLERQIAATDREIDALVYELYGLTEEEIQLVEGGKTHL